jgi:dynein heavy chain, axonemal
MARFEELCRLLEDFEKQIFTEWCGNIPPIIEENLSRSLLLASPEKVLSLNFVNELVVALKEIKHMKLMNLIDIPETALNFFALAEPLWQARMKLSRITEWYNYIREATVQCEFDIIAPEIEEFEMLLEAALTTATWENYEQSYIDEMYNVIKGLKLRIEQSKTNLGKITSSIRSWGRIPLYERKDVGKLLNLDDRITKVPKRMQECNESKLLIEQMMDQNFRLFFNLPIKPEETAIVEDEEETKPVEGEEEMGEEQLDPKQSIVEVKE